MPFLKSIIRCSKSFNFFKKDMSRITNEALMSAIRRLQESSQKEYNPEQHRDETRSWIAKNFVDWFFKIIFWGTVVMLVYNLLIYLSWDWERKTEIKDIMIDIFSALPILISAISWPLGFVVWYYFKTEANK